MLATISLLLLVGFVAPAYGIQSCNCVAFRLDDVQDYWLDDVQTKIINTFQEKNASLTVGIIANYFGHDKKIVELVSERLYGKPELEIANHGWNHESFGNLTEEQQWWLIRQANQKIYNTTGVTPTIFITPYDKINNDTFKAAQENNINIVSANETSERGPYPLENTSLYKLPQLSQFGNSNKNFTDWINYDKTYVHARIIRGVVQYGYAVVVMHPQDFSIKHGINYTNAINYTRIDELNSIIDEIRSDNLKIVTISEIPRQQKLYLNYPQWVTKVSQWYFDYKISSSDFEKMVDYLKYHKLLTLGLVDKYPVHKNISAINFWIGEPPSADNSYIRNVNSTSDSRWVQDFGGAFLDCRHDSFLPVGFHPRENPFYVALPYNDFASDGSRKSDATSTYGYDEKRWTQDESIVKK